MGTPNDHFKSACAVVPVVWYPHADARVGVLERQMRQAASKAEKLESGCPAKDALPVSLKCLGLSHDGIGSGVGMYRNIADNKLAS
jgi:hypothetical protein